MPNLWFLFIGLAAAAYINRPRPDFKGPGFTVKAGLVRVTDAVLAEDWARKVGATTDSSEGLFAGEVDAWGRLLTIRLFGTADVWSARSGEPAYRMLVAAMQGAIDAARTSPYHALWILGEARKASDLAGAPAVDWPTVEW